MQVAWVLPVGTVTPLNVMALLWLGCIPINNINEELKNGTFEIEDEQLQKALAMSLKENRGDMVDGFRFKIIKSI